MQTATTTARKAPPIRMKPQTEAASSPPPIIVPELDILPADETRYPRAIFGKLPDGFVLKNQQIHMLVFWLRKAMTAIDEVTGKTDAEMAAALVPANELLEAIKGSTCRYPHEIAAQMQAIVEWLEFTEEDCIEVELNAADFKRFAQNLAAATAPIKATKSIGPLQRGRKLTRAGLLTRYQAFLIQELETIGWNLYGASEIALCYRPYDYEVSGRCDDRKCRYPFFDERKLPDRARRVLKSLKIDTDHANDRSLRKVKQA